MNSFRYILSVRNAACGLLLAGLLLGGCSVQEDATTGPDATGVRVEVSVPALQSKALGDPTYAVNRVLILPFVKTTEGATDDPANFTPVYASAKQIDVNSFTAYATIPNLDPAKTHRMLLIGYNRLDYNYNPASPNAVSGKFSIGSVAGNTTLANFHVHAVSAVDVPEFFTITCGAFVNGNGIGVSFKPQQFLTLKGALQRLVSGVSVKVTGLPAAVSSVKLSADKLVLASTTVASNPADTAGRPTIWQNSGDAGNKVLGTAVPASGNVTIEKIILPTFATRKTRLILTVTYAGLAPVDYPVIVQDMPAVSKNNYLLFVPNQVIRITGTYTGSNMGFTCKGTINLDDNAWDGIH